MSAEEVAEPSLRQPQLHSTARLAARLEAEQVRHPDVVAQQQPRHAPPHPRRQRRWQETRDLPTVRAVGQHHRQRIDQPHPTVRHLSITIKVPD